MEIPSLVDTDFLYEMISKNEFVRYSNAMNADKCLDIAEAVKIRLTDEQAQKIIEKYSNCYSATDFQKLDTKSREEFIVLFKEQGLSIRQISRLTGTSKGLVEKYLNN